MANAVGFNERFSIVRVFANLFRAIAANWVALLLFSAMLALVGTAFNALTMNETIKLMPTGPGADANSGDPLALFKAPLYWLGLLVAMLVSSFGLAGLIAGCLASDTDDRPDLSGLFSAGGRNMLRVFGQTLFALFLVVLASIPIGIMLAIFVAATFSVATPDPTIIGIVVLGGLGLVFAIFMAIWGVSTQAMVAEDIGLFASLGRSWVLTKGSRFWVLLAYVLFFGVYFLVLYAAQGFSTSFMLDLWRKQFAVALALNAATTTVLTPLVASFMASLYREVRLVREGDTTVGLADVFA
jgi:hypothetical protein